MNTLYLFSLLHNYTKIGILLKRSAEDESDGAFQATDYGGISQKYQEYKKGIK